MTCKKEDRVFMGGQIRSQFANVYINNDNIKFCLHMKKQLGQNLHVCQWHESAYDIKGHPLVEVRLCWYSYELRGLLHGIKELVVIVLITGLTFSRSCRTFKWRQN